MVPVTLIPEPPFALLLDLDGTLVDLAPTPDDIQVSASLLHSLRILHQQLGGALACISGRSYQDLAKWLSPCQIDLIGSHGAELEGPAQPDPSWLAWQQQCMSDIQTQWPQVLIERKPLGLAIHWRQAPAAQPTITQWVQQHACCWPEHECLEGKCVLEIRPRHANKGDALRRLMQQPAYRNRTPWYLGDDTTDLAAFDAVHALGGHSIAVGPKVAQHAHYGLASPQAVEQWLESLSHAKLWHDT